MKRKYGLKILVRDRLRWIYPQALRTDLDVLREAIARLSPPRDGSNRVIDEQRVRG